MSTELGYTREVMTIVVKKSNNQRGSIGIINIYRSQTQHFHFCNAYVTILCAVQVVAYETKYKKRCLSSGQEINRIHADADAM